MSALCVIIQVLGAIDLNKDFDFGKCSAIYLLEFTLGSKDIYCEGGEGQLCYQS